MQTLRLTSFGMRGYVGEALTPNVVMDYVSAFAGFVESGAVLVGRDTRYSSPMIHSSVLAALTAAGCEVIDLGVCPTPMVQFFVKHYGGAGGVSISGGHNAMGWNAIALIGSNGAFLEPMGGEAVLDAFHARNFPYKDWEHLGQVSEPKDFTGPYFDRLTSLVNADAIRARKLRVIIDPVGGSGCDYLAPFAKVLGLDLIPVNGEPSGYLAREAEPRPRSAKQMASIIRPVQGDIGFVLSSDMNRMSIVTEVGEPVSEEYTFALIANYRLGKTPGTLVTNVCTSRSIDDIAKAHGAEVVKTRVGQAYVVSTLADEQGVIAGEGSGSVALPEFGMAFDGFLMMALLLDAIATQETTIASLIEALPRYHIMKRNVDCDSLSAYRAMETVTERFGSVQNTITDNTDGIRLDWEDGWIHVRASKTQKLVRVISEATSREVAEQRANDVVRMISTEV